MQYVDVVLCGDILIVDFTRSLSKTMVLTKDSTTLEDSYVVIWVHLKKVLRFSYYSYIKADIIDNWWKLYFPALFIRSIVHPDAIH